MNQEELTRLVLKKAQNAMELYGAKMRIEELERRVLWLERKLTARDMHSKDCYFCKSTTGHKKTCQVFDSEGRVKPTSEKIK